MNFPPAECFTILERVKLLTLVWFRFINVCLNDAALWVVSVIKSSSINMRSIQKSQKRRGRKEKEEKKRNINEKQKWETRKKTRMYEILRLTFDILVIAKKTTILWLVYFCLVVRAFGHLLPIYHDVVTISFSEIANFLLQKF